VLRAKAPGAPRRTYRPGFLTRSSGHGLAVSVADGGAAMREVMAERPVDLVILDLRMPGEDGLSLARALRAEGGIGIVMLTAAGEPIDRVVGLEVGADDYLAKPFDPRELLARVRSVLRRVRPDGGAPAAPATSGEVRFGRCVLNLDTRKLYTLDGSEAPMTAMEFDLLKLLAANPSRVLTRDELLEGAHNRSWEPFDRSIDIRIWRLRQKVEPDPSKPEVIKTIRGGGYMFVPAGPGRG
jgi:two-component system phosphate regulon response regulator OmpR